MIHSVRKEADGITIKQFALLCGCNPQTLRYYDHVDLLKPVKVDQWSGYRYYDEDQALVFVKIKNLQAAGFAIDEIRELLDKDTLAIYTALEAKVIEQEKRLQEIKKIQMSYKAEMDSMRKKLETIQEEVRKSMEQYDPMEEFGVDVVTYREMIDSVNSFFEDQINRGGDSDIEFSEYDESDDTKEEPVYVKLLENPDNDIVYERHGWKFVKDFFSDIPVLEDGQDYDMLFQIIPGKANNTAFANIALGLLLRSYPRDPEKKRSLGCSVSDSKDGINHFWLLKRKA